MGCQTAVSIIFASQDFPVPARDQFYLGTWISIWAMHHPTIRKTALLHPSHAIDLTLTHAPLRGMPWKARINPAPHPQPGSRQLPWRIARVRP